MPSRHVQLDGSVNLRDIGGYETVDGSFVRTGCVFRSDELHALTDADHEVLAKLGIRVVFDLRSTHERTEHPNRLPVDVEVLERTSPTSSSDVSTLEDLIARGELPVPDDDYVAGTYIDLLERLAPELKIILERAVDAPTRPLLFHCVAGKDRTGITAALLLNLLGVSDELILDDYELTTVHFTPARMEALAALLEEHGVADERVRPLMSARRPVLAAALARVRERWGDFEGYARDELEVPADLPDRLRAALLVRDATA